MVRLITVLTLVFSLAVISPGPLALAQSFEGQTSGRAIGPRKQIATIIFSGLAGAILGLSTLSFYGRPQDKLQNIAFGFALGIIAGTTYTTYKAASSVRGSGEAYPSGVLFKQEPEAWGNLAKFDRAQQSPTIGTAWSWEF